MKKQDLYWPAMVFLSLFLFVFGFTVTVSSNQLPPPGGTCCHVMCPGSSTDTSYYGYFYNNQCINGPGPYNCDYRAFTCSYID